LALAISHTDQIVVLVQMSSDSRIGNGQTVYLDHTDIYVA